MTVFRWLLLTLGIFSGGIYGVLTRRNAVAILISVELMLNAGALNFVIVNRYLSPSHADGQVMAIFIMAIAAAEILVGMSILIMLFRQKRNVDVTQLSRLKH